MARVYIGYWHNLSGEL